MLQALYKEHSASLIRFLTRRLKSVEEAEDIAHAALLRIEKLDDGVSLNNPKAYLFQIASNLAIDSIRRKEVLNRYIQRESSRIEATNRSKDNLSPERIIAAKQQLSQINLTLAKLPVKPRQAFLLHRQKGLSYSEIAEEMGVSVSSVEKYILQALQQCRKTIHQSDIV
ncbi:MAG: RNA polymerase sigma factor [Cellvibrionaceae bacterium]